MPLLQKINENQYVKLPTGADYNRPSGILKDRIVVVSEDQATTSKISTGFHYYQGTRELEVYLNGQFLMPFKSFGGINYGDYSEDTNFSVTFKDGLLNVGDIVRFRVTSSSYNESMYTSATTSTKPSGVGYLPVGIIVPDLSKHKTWKTSPYINEEYTITGFYGGADGETKTIVFSNNFVTIESNDKIFLAGGISFTGDVNDCLVLVFDQQPAPVWRETTRTLY